MNKPILNKKGFSKRTYKLKDFLYDLMTLLYSCPCLIRAAHEKTVEPAFREKIMLAVSNVLGCRFCSWLHTELILKEGVDKKEITKILVSEIGSFPEHEAVALAFAIHYSESQGKPKKEPWERFLNYYGEDTAKTILSYIKAIYWGNLTGNTVEKGDIYVWRSSWAFSYTWPISLVVVFIIVDNTIVVSIWSTLNYY